MPKKSCQRTFTACWTCRRRNVRCDKAVPGCSQCKRMQIECEGYHIRLVWVDSDTGTYIPQQRRAYPCELTWKGYPIWSLKEVGHLIDHCENRPCRCLLHTIESPFCVFPQQDEKTAIVKNEGEAFTSELFPALPGHDSESVDSSSLVASTVSTEGQSAVVATRQSTIAPPRWSTSPSGSKYGEKSCFDMDDKSHHGHREVGLKGHLGSSIYQPPIHSTISINRAPAVSLTPSGNHTENQYFYHYVSHVSMLMIPIDGGHNPWKSTYPSIAIQDTSSSSTRSLYHAILAQSAFNLANLKGPRRGVDEKAHAMRYFGMALRELRESLATPSEDYSSVLAALLTVTIVEHVFSGKSRGWREHFRGAMGFVSQYLSQQPWMLSRDAWIITQNFALSNVIAQTAGDCSASTENITEVYEVLCDVMKRANFGFTIGGTARLIKSIYQIRLLEVQMTAISCRGAEELSKDMINQVENIIQQLQIPLDDEVEVFMEQQKEPTNLMVLPRTRNLVNLHLNLFNGAVMIYLLRMVLRLPPSAVAEYVWEVLTDTMAFTDMHGGNVSVWPVFVAAVEAYTPESQALARRFLIYSEKLGVGNRDDLHRVIHQVWAEREELATGRQCDPGDVIVDWREIMKRLDIDILLL